MTYRLNWKSNQALKRITRKADKAALKGARHVLMGAKRRVRRQSGELASAIRLKESRYNGYIVGVFAANTTPWEKSLGARAVFIEFGHAAPNRGRGNIRRKNIVKTVSPYPFIRPALRAARSQVLRHFKRELKNV